MFVKNWDGSEYSLNDLREIVDCARDSEQSVDEVMGGDLASSEFVIRGLLDIIDDLQSKSREILMSKTNHDGWKLEVLLQKIADELAEKNQYLLDTGRTDLGTIIENNSAIITALLQSVSKQNDSMKFMEQFGPNKGPSHPRV